MVGCPDARRAARPRAALEDLWDRSAETQRVESRSGRFPTEERLNDELQGDGEQDHHSRN